VALAHDWLVGYRGGEAVLERIARVVGERAEISGLYVMFDDGRALSPAVDALRARGRVHVSALNRLPGGAGRLRRWLLPLYPLAVSRLSARLARDHAEHPIDLLISTSSAAIKGLRSPAPPGVPHICYCHSPARYIWSQAEQYSAGAGGSGARLRWLGLRLAGGPFRRWDRRTSANVTRFVANSTHTSRQIFSAYGRDSTVVHPPVRTGFFTPDPGAVRDGSWLIVSALEPYKRIELAIDAAGLAGRRLIIAGKGSHRGALEAHARGAGADVEFRGRVGDEELRALYRACALLLFPQVEDFGIVAAEALACGMPVVARRAGGALDIVEDGITGALFDAATPGAIVAAAARCPTHTALACRAAAERFGGAEFDRRIMAVIWGR
jgi:glycosyltransferase involved in cell wall biosynthesis